MAVVCHETGAIILLELAKFMSVHAKSEARLR
jgi:hypothetical protein